MGADRPTNDWRHQRGTANGRPGRKAPPSRKFRGRVALLFAVVSAGAIVGLILWKKEDPKPLFVGIAVTDYEEVRGWPINGFAGQDADALRATFPGDAVQTVQSQEAEPMLAEIRRLGDRTRGARRAAVLSLSVFGVADGAGVAVLPAKADPRDAASWLPLAKVIEAARTIDPPLLFLLEVRPVDDPRHGFLGPACRANLHAELTRLAGENLIPFDLFVSSSPAEPPYFSPELKRGAFAFALEEGLKGRADGWAGDPPDRDVTAEELIAFARTRVRQWHDHYKTPHFPPQRYGVPRDVRLVSLAREIAPTPAPEPLGPPPAWLTAAWANLDLWRGKDAHRDSPRAFADYRDAVARAELRWLGGVPGPQIEADVVPKFRDWQAKLHADAAAGPPVWSLARAAQTLDAKVAADVEKSLLPVVRKLRQHPAAKSEDIDAVLKPLAEKEVAAEWLAAAQLHLFNVLITQPDPAHDYMAAQLRDAINVVSAFRTAPEFSKPLPTEWHAVRLLADADPEIRHLWEAGTLPVMLRATLAAEEAIVADPRSAGKIEPLLRAADADFQTHFVTMFKPGQKARETALAALKSLADRYREIRLLADADAAARREWDETAAALRVLADTPVTHPGNRPEAERVWADLLAAFGDVRAKIDGSVDAGELTRTAGLLRDHRKRYAGLVVPLPTATLRDQRAALRSPWWDSKTRTAMESAARDLANSFAPAAAELVTAGPKDMAATAASVADDPGLDAGRLKRLALLMTTAGQHVRLDGSEVELAGRLRDASAVVRERFAKGTDAERAAVAWALGPRGSEKDSADPVVTLRREAERKWAAGLARDRYMAFAAKADQLPHPSAKEFAAAMRKLAAFATTTSP